MQLLLFANEIIPFVIVTALSFVQGVRGWRRMQEHFAAHWTRDNELFHWRQGPPDARLGDRASYLYMRFGQIIGFLFLLLPILFILDPVDGVWFLWPCIAVAMPASHAGVALADLLFVHSGTRSVTVTDTGVVAYGLFFPWNMISHFEHDSIERSIRLYARRTPHALLAVLQPPDELGAGILATLQQHVAARPAQAPGTWYRRSGGGEGRFTALFLLGIALAATAYALPNRALACVLLAVGFWAWLKLSVRVVERTLGITYGKEQHGLSRRDLPPSAAPQQDQIAPAIGSLHRLSLVDLFDAAIRLYRRHFGTLVSIAALLYVPAAILRFAALAPFGDDSVGFFFASSRWPLFAALTFISSYSLGWGIMSMLLYLAVQPLIIGALTDAAARSYLGHPVSIAGACRGAGGRFVALLLASIVPALFSGGSAIISEAFPSELVWPSLLASRGEPVRIIAALASGLPALVPLLAVLVTYTYMLLIPQAIMIEGRGPLSSLIRSWRLIGGSFWRSFAVLASTAVITYLLTAPPTVAVALAPYVGDTAVIVAVVGQQIGLILALPIQAYAFTLLYYDLRMRKEGYDISISLHIPL